MLKKHRHISKRIDERVNLNQIISLLYSVVATSITDLFHGKVYEPICILWNLIIRESSPRIILFAWSLSLKDTFSLILPQSIQYCMYIISVLLNRLKVTCKYLYLLSFLTPKIIIEIAPAIYLTPGIFQQTF